MSYVLEVKNLHKTFKTDFWKPKVKILHDVSFYVEENSICGLVGPNGAGKTTIIKSILDFVHPEQGTVSFFGSSIHDAKVKEKIGYLPEQAYYYEYLTGYEFLSFYGNLFGLSKKEKNKRITHLLQQVGLSHAADRKLRNYSKGMLQRIGIAQSLINDPQFVILDEPMTGLDPIGRKEIRDIIFDLKKQGKTVLVCSHILSDIEYLCDHVILIVHGKVKAFGQIKEVVQPNVHRIDYYFNALKPPVVPKHWEGKIEMKTFPNKNILYVLEPEEITFEQVIAWFDECDAKIDAMVPHKDSLEDLMVQSLKEGV
ncbi:MAG: ABC transporter ATP-binding protein [Deltaproteobacteria bacterium]|nr:ABC transporter ATP-binding protein [Deltaproteobacteria bacterium]